MIVRRAGQLIAVLALVACKPTGENAGGRFRVNWTVLLDDAGADCTDVGVPQVEVSTTDDSGFETLEQFPCENLTAKTAVFAPGPYTLVVFALDPSGLRIATADTIPLATIDPGAFTSLTTNLRFSSAPTTGTISVIWTTNGSVASVGCPANGMVQVDLDGGSRQIVPCTQGAVGFTDVAPGAHTIDTQLADQTGPRSSMSTSTNVTAGATSDAIVDFVF